MGLNIEDNQKMLEEILEAYPEKARKDRQKHFEINNEELINCGKCAIKSNMKSRPGL